MNKLYNVNVVSSEALITPGEIKKGFPLTQSAEATVMEGRQEIQRILDHEDSRFIVIVGPCSIHDSQAAIEYATRLKNLAEELNDTFLIIMRVYFEKPRTTIGWKGFINDPYMDDSFKIQDGLIKARKLLLQFAEMQLPTATEALDPITPQYLSDLLAWSAIGARTTESQTHREMASGLSMPVGFKNGTDGSVQVAVDALQSALHPHSFLGVDQNGRTAIFRTKGNTYGHIVLRGGSNGPNFDEESVNQCELALANVQLPANIVVDCSHANSFKDHKLQPRVLDDVVSQILKGNKSLVGVMLESNLFEGNQPIPKDLSQLKYGVSITDKCLAWDETEVALRQAYHKLRDYLPSRFK